MLEFPECRLTATVVLSRAPLNKSCPYSDRTYSFFAFSNKVLISFDLEENSQVENIIIRPTVVLAGLPVCR